MPARNALYVVAALSIAGLAISTSFYGHPPRSLSEWLAPLGPSVAVAVVGLWAFNRWIWRLPLVRNLHGRPLLRGTWHGELASERVDPSTDLRVPPDPDVFLVVRQEFWDLSVRMLTKESKSYSLSAAIRPGGDGVSELVYLYCNTPRMQVRHRSEMHYGAVVLTAPSDNGAGLEGHYFTDRSTRGELHFSRRFAKPVETHDAGRKLVDAAGA